MGVHLWAETKNLSHFWLYIWLSVDSIPPALHSNKQKVLFYGNLCVIIDTLGNVVDYLGNGITLSLS